MDIFGGHQLEQNQHGYTLTIFINQNTTQFSKEFCQGNFEKCEPLIETIYRYINQNFSSISIDTVKLVLGSVIVATIAIGNPQTADAETNATTASTVNSSPDSYTVQPGDTLWGISQMSGVSINEIKAINNLESDTIYPYQKLNLKAAPSKETSAIYTVNAGDTLWQISQKLGVSVSDIKQLNSLTSDMIYIGQKLKVECKTYTVQPGDVLWKIAHENNSTVNAIKSANNLTTDIISIGQILIIPDTVTPSPSEDSNQPSVSTKSTWPEVTYIVQPGDTVSAVAKKFGTTVSDILKYNYMEPDEWLYAGDKIAISGFAPRTYTVSPGESTSPSSTGKLVDWVTEGQYIIKAGDVFTIVDKDTGRHINAKMMGGYNHSDIEPLTAADTEAMKELFGTWEWSPRSVVIYKDGMNIAGSLSGMPHGADTINDNGVSGHFDLYLLNSTSHKQTVSEAYVKQHYDMVLKASR